MTTLVATKYPGSDTPPIKTFPEKLEKDIGNIVGRFHLSKQEVEPIIYELLDYIIKRDELILSRNKKS